MKCTGCDTDGREGPALMPGDDPLDKINSFLNNDEDDGKPVLFGVGGAHYCYPCQCKVENKCYQCDEEVNTLYRDTRCHSGPYVCGPCLGSPRVNHLWQCYADGCMTPGAIAQEEWEMLSLDGAFDETNH